MTDEPQQLTLVSPNMITTDWDGTLFAELQASFSVPSQRYHCIGRFMFCRDDRDNIVQLAGSCQTPLVIRTVDTMTVFEVMTGK